MEKICVFCTFQNNFGGWWWVNTTINVVFFYGLRLEVRFTQAEQKIMGPEFFLDQDNFGPAKIVGSKKNLGPKHKMLKKNLVK